MKERQILFFIGVIMIITWLSCTQEKILTHHSGASNRKMFVLNKEINYDKTIIFDKEVTIYPEAFLKTGNDAHLVFTKKVNILGESQVFDEKAKIVFNEGTISTLNPCWFGAKGYDTEDDTKAFQKVLEIADVYINAINIEIPIGKYYISEPLEIKNGLPEEVINIIGSAMSGNSTLGSCLIWRGEEHESMIKMKNNSTCTFLNLDFNAEQKHNLRYAVEIRPIANQVVIRNCSFSGCSGPGSANINLNAGNNLQVSEITVENCVFRSVTYDNKKWLTESGVIGGMANTKNFYIKGCSFIGYTKGAINIDITDILKVENCTFAINNVDIICSLCNTLASANYSEYSKSFFKSSVSQNVAFTTLSDNCFYGSPDADYVIPEGSGSLILVNNNFGGMGGNDQINKIKWDESAISSINSIGNYYRNDMNTTTPFYNNHGEKQKNQLHSVDDKSGTNELNIYKIPTKN